jgi:hypothetical protein
MEVEDWPRRDKMKREGKTVYPVDEEWMGGWQGFGPSNLNVIEGLVHPTEDVSMFDEGKMEVDWLE